jgi:DNA-binding transcriptional ArsR family regulator
MSPVVRAAASADVFHAIADPTRRRILELLARGERTVSQLVRAFRISQPSVSEHLRVLRESGLARARPVGRMRVYGLDARRLREVAEWVAVFDRFWEERLESLGQFLRRKHGTRSERP